MPSFLRRATTFLPVAQLAAGCAFLQRPGAPAEPLTWVPTHPASPALCVSEVPAAGRLHEGRAAWESGTALLQAGDLQQARVVLSAAGDEPAAQSARAALAVLSGDLRTARTSYRELLLAWPDDGCLAQAAAFVYLASGQVRFAATHSADARNLLPTEPDVLFLDGLVRASTGDVGGAAADYREALARAPGQPAVSAALGAIYVEQGDAVLALPLLETAAGAGFDVESLLVTAWYGAGRTSEYVRAVARDGYPVPRAEAIAAADDPLAAFRAALGVGELGRLMADLHTSRGTLHCELAWRQAPVAVGNFVGLSRGELPWKDPTTGERGSGPFYDGTTFHRVIPDFMVQGGDRAGDGTGDPGYAFRDEIDPTLRFDRGGVLAMANHGPNTNGSQFFITEQAVPHLTGGYTVFGRCDDDSVKVVKDIARVPRGPADRPTSDVVLEHIEIRGE